MKAAVLGNPVSHSLSPVLHRAAYAALGLADWTYEAVEVDENGLAAFMDGLDTDGLHTTGERWSGLSLTMPLKGVVLSLLDAVSPLAEAVGSVNTVTFPGGRRVGDNTDVHGMVAALAEAGVDQVSWGCVLGGGSTAASALAALRELGCRTPTVYVRSTARAAAIRRVAADLGVQPALADWDGAWESLCADVVISTVPAGATDELAGQLAGDPVPTTGPVLLDVVYAPWPTQLARTWRRRGGAVVPGWQMLLHQAAAQVTLMTGREAPLEAMRAALVAEVHARP